MTESQGWIMIGALTAIGLLLAWELAIIVDRLTDLLAAVREDVRKLK